MKKLRNRWDFSVESNSSGFNIWATDLMYGDIYEFFMHFRSRKEAEDYIPLASADWAFTLNPDEWHMRSWKSY